MSKKPNPHCIRAGDILHLRVPENRCIPSQVYAAEVTDVTSHKGRSFQRLRLKIDLGNDNTSIIRASLATRAFRGHTHEPLYLFLGADQFPVDYTHEQNILQRLTDSVYALNNQRKPYTD